MKKLYRRIKALSFILVPFLVVVFAGAAIYFLYPRINEQKQSELKFEVIKFLAQLIIIVFLGGILVHEYNRGRDRAKAVNEFRKILLNNIIRAYFDTKKARRILSANVLLNPKSNKKEILYSIYEEQLKKLNETQLEFEFFKYQLGTFHYAFRNFDGLKKQARSLEAYLNYLVDEYKELKASGGPTQLIEISKLPRLDGFVSTKEFRANFSNVFHSAVKLIQDEILRI